ncbi:hypothetical protein V1L52_02755 [Treponema sp. HNW]|uniref:hypothetical protein n=1 Tax=Treponema sp. HNW TaxID=3116654 RepID=UPI003D0A27E5
MKFFKYTSLYVFIAVSALLPFTGASCSVFTTPLGKALKRNQTAVLKRASASELIEFSRTPYASSPETTKALMDLLAGTDIEELTALSLRDKETALKLAMDVSFPMSTLKSVTQEALIAVDGGLSNEEAGRIIIKLIDGINTFNTSALSALLTDTEVMRSADSSVLVDASLALLIQTTADIYDSAAHDIDFKNDSVDTIINKILGGQSGFEEKKAALRASLTAIKLLSGESVKSSAEIPVLRVIDASQTKFIGLIPLDTFLAGFGK